MSRSYRSRRLYLVTFLTLIAVIAGWVLVAGNLKLPEFVTAFHSALRRPTVSAQLMYYDPLPADAMDDDNCKLVPVSASTALAADPLQEGSSGETAPADVSGKKPVRMIRDRYAVL